jgi:amino acid adenylation domain-containing protein
MSASQSSNCAAMQSESSDVDINDWLGLACGAPLPHADFIPEYEMVSLAADASPNAPAVRSGEKVISYRELITWARLISGRLTRAGVGAGDRVAVLAEPSVAMVAAVLSVVASGAAYVPVDLAQPDARLAAILEDAGATAIVVTRQTAERANGASIPLVTVADGPDAEPGDEATPDYFAAGVRPEDPAYLIYTSGSTGEPRGVIVEHGQLAVSMRARRLVYPGTPTFLLVSSLAFDSSVAGLWGTLEAGGCLVVAASDEVRDGERLVELISEHRVTQILCVPSLYRVLLDAANRLGVELLSSLKSVIVAGEALPESLVRLHFASHRHVVELTNEYGPTEATVWASYHRFTESKPVSIGRPIPGGRLYVLDPEQRPVSRGVEGELYIGGATVARGYHGRPDASAEVFLADPFAQEPDARMYRTGDMARWTENDTLEFLGRRDDQVKIRGHRVELGMVQAVLCEAEGVREAVVLPDPNGDCLIAFITVVDGTDTAQVRQHASEHLPRAAVPADIRILPDLPRNLNGKLDRNKLRSALEQRQQPSGRVISGGGDETVGMVTEAWAQVLDLGEIPMDVSFFDLGGHSLTMFNLQEALEERCGIRPSVVELYLATTVTAQSELIREMREHGHTSGSPLADGRARAMRMRQQRSRQQEAK